MRKLFFAIALCFVNLAAAQAATPVKRHITEKDLFGFVWIADPQISPDGSRVAFVRVTVNDKKAGYDTALWTVASDGKSPPQRLTGGPHDSAPRWSPDGARLLFLRGTEREGRPEPAQLALISMTGGEARVITAMPKGAESPVWSPEGKAIAFLSRSNATDMARAQRSQQGQAGSESEAERESDVRVIVRAVYRSNATGYLDPTRHAHIWRVEAPAAVEEKVTPRQLTFGEFDEEDPQWSRDGSRIYFVSTRIAEPYYDPAVSVLYSIPASGGEIAQVAAIDGVISDFALSPDGKQIVFRGQISKPVVSYRPPHVFVTDSTPGAKPRDLAPGLEGDAGSGLLADQRAPRGGHAAHPVWADGGNSVLEVVAERGIANLRRFYVGAGRIEPVTSGNHEVVSFTATPDGSKVVALISTPTLIGDLYAVGPNGALTRLTDVNGKLFSELELTEPEEFSYTSFDGKKIQAWVQKPPDFEAGKRYPLILNIHGGPHAAYGYTFDHEFQWMAAKGYVVLYPNPRGSSSYGREFGNIIQYEYPGDDYKDLMAGVDELVRRGYVDEKKLGVTGGSGGGVLTNWTVVHTNRFAAAVSQRSIADWSTFWYTADFTLFTPFWFRAAPWQDAQDYVARSAITQIANCKTPLMLIEGEADYRTPPAGGGEQMFRALKFLKVPTAMVRFPGESHELSRSGSPWHRVERLEHIVNWFDKYLQGREIHLYDLPQAEAAPKKEVE